MTDSAMKSRHLQAHGNVSSESRFSISPYRFKGTRRKVPPGQSRFGQNIPLPLTVLPVKVSIYAIHLRTNTL